MSINKMLNNLKNKICPHCNENFETNDARIKNDLY